MKRPSVIWAGLHGCKRRAKPMSLPRLVTLIQDKGPAECVTRKNMWTYDANSIKGIWKLQLDTTYVSVHLRPSASTKAAAEDKTKTCLEEKPAAAAHFPKAIENKSQQRAVESPFCKEAKCSSQIFPLLDNLAYFRHIAKCVYQGFTTATVEKCQ